MLRSKWISVRRKSSPTKMRLTAISCRIRAGGASEKIVGIFVGIIFSCKYYPFDFKSFNSRFDSLLDHIDVLELPNVLNNPKIK